jgi:hypothetical protein
MQAGVGFFAVRADGGVGDGGRVRLASKESYQ